jgi:hypothetical protein
MQKYSICQRINRRPWCPGAVWDNLGISNAYDSQPAEDVPLNYNSYRAVFPTRPWHLLEDKTWASRQPEQLGIEHRRRAEAVSPSSAFNLEGVYRMPGGLQPATSRYAAPENRGIEGRWPEFRRFTGIP